MSTDQDAEFDSTINDIVDETTEVSTQETEEVTPDLPNSVKKLLSQKNALKAELEQEKTGKQELSERLANIEKELEKQKFFAKYPWADSYETEIDAYMESEKVSRENAYKLLIADDPQIRAKLSQSNPFVWNAPRSITEEKSFDTLTIAEKRAELKRNQDAIRKAIS